MTQKRFVAKNAAKKTASSKKHGKNWVMAVDPFSGFDVTPLRDLVIPLAEESDADIYAAYVLAPASFNWTGEFSGPWMKRYRPLAEEKLAELFPESVIRPTIVPCHTAGVRASAKALVHFAEKLKAENIIISTHARGGIERLALGSFAESVIATSKIPVLVVNPERHVPDRVRRILVTTDLSKRAEKYAIEMADYAKRIGAEVVLYYNQPDPLDPVIQQGVYSLGGGWVSVQNFFEEDMKAKRKQMDKLEQLIAKRGVHTSQLVDAGGPDGLVASINSAADSHTADMIAVLTESGPWSAALLGSVARGLVRSSNIPVLVRR